MPSNGFLNEIGRPNFLQKKEASSVLKKVFKASHVQDDPSQTGHLAGTIGCIQAPQFKETSYIRFRQSKKENYVQKKNASFEKTRRKGIIKRNFHNYPQQKYDECILLIFSLAKQG